MKRSLLIVALLLVASTAGAAEEYSKVGGKLRITNNSAFSITKSPYQIQKEIEAHEAQIVKLQAQLTEAGKFGLTVENSPEALAEEAALDAQPGVV